MVVLMKTENQFQVYFGITLFLKMSNLNERLADFDNHKGAQYKSENLSRSSRRSYIFSYILDIW